MAQSTDWRSLYPFKSHWCDVDGHRMHYVDEGSGPPLLMVHGNPTWSFYWRNLIKGLQDQCRVIAVDHIGCGLSDKPKNYSYSLENHTRNLSALVEQLDLRDVTLMVHDWGGAIGLGACVADRGRFARLVQFNTAAFPPPFFPWRIRMCRTPLLGRLAVQGFNGFARAALRMAVEHPERLTREIRAGLLAPYDSWSNRKAIYQFVRDIPWSQRHPTYKVLVELEKQLDQFAELPSIFLWGMQDWCFRPECLERMLDHFPDAVVVRIQDAGHYVVEEAHEQILEELCSFFRRFPVAEPSRSGGVEGG